MNGWNIVIEQDKIEQFEKTATAFLRDMFDMDYATTLVTDISDLSDFAFRGDYTWVPNMLLSHKQLVAGWDEWVIAKVLEKYGITLTTAVVNLVWLFNEIELSENVKIH